MSLQQDKHSIRNYYIFDQSKDKSLEEYQAKIETLIEILENSFDQLGGIGKGDNDIDFQLVYSKTYEICINRMSEELYNAVKKMLKKILKTYKDSLSKQNDTNPNYDFFNSLIKLTKFYKMKLEAISDALSYMERVDTDNSNANANVNSIAMNELNDSQSQYNSEAIRFSIEPLMKKGMQLFYQIIIFDDSLKDKVNAAVIREIDQLRNNDYQLNDKFTTLFNLFTDKSYSTISSNSNELIEMIITETKQFYTNQCKVFIEKLSKASDKTSAYNVITSAIHILNSSMQSESKLFNDLNAKDTILRTIFDTMIKDNYTLIKTKAMRQFFKHNNTEAFASLYALFFNYPQIDLGNEYSSFFTTTVQELLDAQLKKLGDTSVIYKSNSTTQVDYVNFPRYVDEICDMRRNCSKLLQESFNQNVKLEHIIKSVFEKYINHSSTFLQHFVRLIHEEIKLSQKIRSTKSLMDFIEKFPIVFKLINDKDLFEEEYRLALSKRLIRNASMIKETEVDFYAIMKKESGVNYVKKIQSMIMDIFASQDINMDFRIQLGKKKEKLSIEFYTKILSQENWPIAKDIMTELIKDQSVLNAIPMPNTNTNSNGTNNCNMESIVSLSTPITLPPSLDKSIQEFTKYYIGKYKNRLVTFIHELSWAEIKAKLNNRSYILIVTTFQLAILMQFNTKTQITKETIASLTKIPIDQIDKHCYPLIKLGILNEEKTYIELNEQFKSDSYKHNCNYIKEDKPKDSHSEEEQNKEVSHLVIEDRKHQIDAAIIHQLKSMKKMQFDELKSAIVKAVSNYFVPDVAFIKGRIENLIDRNYIERDELNVDVYVYTA